MVVREDASVKRAGYPYVTQRELKTVLANTEADEVELMRVFNLSTSEYRDMRVELRRVLRQNAYSRHPDRPRPRWRSHRTRRYEAAILDTRVQRREQLRDRRGLR